MTIARDLFRTLVDRLFRWEEQDPDRPALYARGAGGWEPRTWRQYADSVRAVARALVSLGLQPGDRVAVISRNRPEFLYAQFGIGAAGGVPVPVYVTNTAEQAAWVVRHAGTRFAIVENDEQHRKLAEFRTTLPDLQRVVLVDPATGTDPAWTMGLAEFLALGTPEHGAEVDRRRAAARPEDLSFLCYTSGTTGNPKGVMLTHRNVDSMARMLQDRFRFGRERAFSYLPLCHVAEQGVTNFVQMMSGGEVFLCEDLQKLRDWLPEVRPNVFLGVPRVWEKFESALRARLAAATGLKARLARWALATELTAFRRQVETGSAGGFARWLANRLVLGKIRAALGLDRVWLCATGSAPIRQDTLEFLASLGLPPIEGYGLSETTVLLTSTHAGRQKFGTVGTAFPEVELRIAEDGEVLARGPNLSPGYYREERLTAELWQDGWLHTGDIGALDADGNLRITDRKKELFKTSGGKYVAPQPLEARLKAIRGVGQAVAIGDGRRFISALLTLDPDPARAVAADLGVPADADLAVEPRFRSWLERRIEEDVNAKLARYETVKRFAILPGEFSIAGGELTPTLKVRRKVVAARHAAAIEALYVEAGD